MFGLSPGKLALAKYLTYKLADLKFEDLQVIARGLDLGEITPEAADGVRAFLQSENVDAVADILSKPALIEKIKGFVVPPKENAIVIQCEHCHNFIKLEFEGSKT